MAVLAETNGLDLWRGSTRRRVEAYLESHTPKMLRRQLSALLGCGASVVSDNLNHPDKPNLVFAERLQERLPDVFGGLVNEYYVAQAAHTGADSNPLQIQSLRVGLAALDSELNSVLGIVRDLRGVVELGESTPSEGKDAQDPPAEHGQTDSQA